MVAGYTRQAAANIQPGLRCNAEDVNAEYNQLATAFDNTSGHDHTGSVAGDGAKISLTASVTGVLPVANGGTGSATGVLTTLSVNPGGVLVGTAGSVPGTGALTLNANTVAPPTASGNLQIVGADGAQALEVLDAFGNFPNLVLRSAAGTAAAPTATPSGGNIAVINAIGRTSAGAYTGNVMQMLVASAEAGAYSSSAQGSRLVISTIPTGSTALAPSLTLQGNAATFSGTATLVGNYLWFAGGSGNQGVSGSGPLIYADAANMILKMGASATAWYIQASSGTGIISVSNAGDLNLLVSSTAVKVSGTTWTNPSSRDLKQKIQPYSQGLQAVLALNPCTYEFAADSGIDAPGPHIGLIHDETAHMPEMHRTLTLGGSPEEPGREVDGLDCSAVTWALVNAVKTLAAEIEELKAKLAAA